MRPRDLLHRAHTWFVVIGSAAAVAFLATVFADAPPATPAFAVERVGDERCVVDDASGTVVLREDGSPECVQPPEPRVQLAHR